MVGRPLLHLVTLLAAKSGAGNTLIGIGSLFDDHLLVGALSAAAADADEPEEARANGEGDADPEGREHLRAHVKADVVGFKRGFEDAGQRTVGSGGGDGSGNGEDGLGLKQYELARSF